MEPKIATHDQGRDDTDPIALLAADSSEATALHRPGPDSEPQPPRLVVLAGPRVGMEVPVTEHEVTIGAFWHDRVHKDAAHRWLRRQVVDTAATLEK